MTTAKIGAALANSVINATTNLAREQLKTAAQVANQTQLAARSGAKATTAVVRNAAPQFGKKTLSITTDVAAEGVADATQQLTGKSINTSPTLGGVIYQAAKKTAIGHMRRNGSLDVFQGKALQATKPSGGDD
jgi:hypothetical protein